MIDAVTSPEKTYSKLLIDRVSSQYNIKSPVLYERIQAVLDYISGMTDVFALDLYRKINGNSLACGVTTLGVNTSSLHKKTISTHPDGFQ